MKVTKKEFAILSAIAINEYNERNYGMPDSAQETSTYTNCLELTHQVDGYPLPEPSSFGGVIASLVKKGLVVVGDEGKDAYVAHTDEGYAVWRKMYDAVVFTGEEAAPAPEPEVAVSAKRATTSYGCAPSALGRWMGAHGYTAKQFKDVLAYLGVEMTPSSITTCVSDGKSEVYRGKLPELSQAHVNEIEIIASGGTPGAQKKALKKKSGAKKRASK